MQTSLGQTFPHAVFLAAVTTNIPSRRQGNIKEPSPGNNVTLAGDGLRGSSSHKSRVQDSLFGAWRCAHTSPGPGGLGCRLRRQNPQLLKGLVLCCTGSCCTPARELRQQAPHKHCEGWTPRSFWVAAPRQGDALPFSHIHLPAAIPRPEALPPGGEDAKLPDTRLRSHPNRGRRPCGRDLPGAPR